MQFLNNLAPHAHLLLRLALAGVFAYHGLGKFGDLNATAQMMQMPVFMVALIGAVEAAAAALIVAGAFMQEWMTRVAGLIIAVIMVGAIALVHWPHGWNSIGNLGMEFQVTLLTAGLFFLLTGNHSSKAGT